MSGEDDEERIGSMTSDHLRKVVPDTFEEGEDTL
jgi:hypothetical protein